MNRTPLRRGLPLWGCIDPLGWGGWRSQGGERVNPIDGQAGEGGKLTVRWRLALP